jgi:hypothetical protein
MNKLKYFINKYIQLQLKRQLKKDINKEKSKNGIITYCIRDAYYKIIKLPFYKKPIFVYSDFENSNIQKITIEIHNYTYLILNILYSKETDNIESSDEEEYEENINDIQMILNMNDEDIIKKNILSSYELKKYEYKKKVQKYLYYMSHITFYIIYIYYCIKILYKYTFDIKYLFMIHFFHLTSEILILHLL